jgi:hypothetical protein
LHFMSEDTKAYDVNGVIWMVDFVELRNYLPDILRERLKEKQKDYLTFATKELKELIGDSIEEIDCFMKLNENALIFFEPPSIDERIVNQYAMFSFMLNPDADKLDWLKERPTLYKRIIIPKDLKWEIRDKLDQANISERIMYPGLDGISKCLARWYSDKKNLKVGK